MTTSAIPDSFTLDAFLLRGPDGLLRILAGGVCVDVHEDDLVELEPLEPPPGLREDRAVRVRLALRRGCRVHHIGDGRPLAEQLHGGPSPFAFASRDGDAPYVPSPRFVARERAYVAELEAGERRAS